MGDETKPSTQRNQWWFLSIVLLLGAAAFSFIFSYLIATDARPAGMNGNVHYYSTMYTLHNERYISEAKTRGNEVSLHYLTDDKGKSEAKELVGPDVCKSEPQYAKCNYQQLHESVLVPRITNGLALTAPTNPGNLLLVLCAVLEYTFFLCIIDLMNSYTSSVGDRKYAKAFALFLCLIPFFIKIWSTRASKHDITVGELPNQVDITVFYDEMQMSDLLSLVLFSLYAAFAWSLHSNAKYLAEWESEVDEKEKAQTKTEHYLNRRNLVNVAVSFIFQISGWYMLTVEKRVQLDSRLQQHLLLIFMIGTGNFILVEFINIIYHFEFCYTNSSRWLALVCCPAIIPFLIFEIVVFASYWVPSILITKTDWPQEFFLLNVVFWGGLILPQLAYVVNLILTGMSSEAKQQLPAKLSEIADEFVKIKRMVEVVQLSTLLFVLLIVFGLWSGGTPAMQYANKLHDHICSNKNDCHAQEFRFDKWTRTILDAVGVWKQPNSHLGVNALCANDFKPAFARECAN